MQLLFDAGRGHFSIAAAYVWIMPAIMLDQILFLRDTNGRAQGYIAWAYVSDETLARLEADDAPFLELAEWNEGCHLWVTDVVIPRGGAPRLRRLFFGRLPSQVKRVRGLRRRRNAVSQNRVVNLPRRRADKLTPPETEL